MSTYYRPQRPLAAEELSQIEGLVFRPRTEETATFSHEFTDEDEAGFLLCRTNVRGQVVEFARFGGNGQFAEAAVETMADALGTRICSSFDPEYEQYDHWTDEDRATWPKPRKLEMYVPSDKPQRAPKRWWQFWKRPSG